MHFKNRRSYFILSLMLILVVALVACRPGADPEPLEMPDLSAAEETGVPEEVADVPVVEQFESDDENVGGLVGDAVGSCGEAAAHIEGEGEFSIAYYPSTDGTSTFCVPVGVQRHYGVELADKDEYQIAITSVMCEPACIVGYTAYLPSEIVDGELSMDTTVSLPFGTALELTQSSLYLRVPDIGVRVEMLQPIYNE